MHSLQVESQRLDLWGPHYFVYSIPRISLTKENVYVIHYVEIAILPALIILLQPIINELFGDSCRPPARVRCGQESVEVLVGAPKVATCASYVRLVTLGPGLICTIALVWIGGSAAGFTEGLESLGGR